MLINIVQTKLQNSSFSITCVYTLHTYIHDYINMYKYICTYNHTQRHVAIQLTVYIAFCFITIIAVGVMKLQCEKTALDELGRFCLTPSQVSIIFNSNEGQWHVLPGK